ncbi:hypothetical protein Tsubulata_018862 [Turnera subulata]|uniref:Replication factor A C-terminal domain-containing protein n=2 Tax=Turnera subulata TaxID=218843 RepID=A0A9Q0FN09_9ROSI|nr:hypothetical protein Tsubulata_018862 [Turnera subulata]
MAISQLRELTPVKETWSIEVRIIRLWESINYKVQDQVISLDVILGDEEGTMMHAIANKMQVQRFRTKFQEGMAYRISKFRVLFETSQYRPVSHEKKLQFFAFTKVESIDCGIDRIPLLMFQFVDAELIIDRCNTTTYLSDIVGLLTSIGPLEPIQTRRGLMQKRNLMMTLSGGQKFEVTLWGQQADLISEDLVHNSKGPMVLALTSLLSKMFLREYTLSSTHATKVYLNPDIPEIKKLLESCDEKDAISLLQKHSSQHASVKEQKSENRKTVTEILEMEKSEYDEDGFKEIRVTLDGKIKELHNRHGWCYFACPNCWKKIDQQDSAKFCLSCSSKWNIPAVRYKVEIMVEDQTGELTLTLFDREVEQLIKMSAMELLDRTNGESQEIPSQIEEMLQRNVIFQIKITPYNIKYGWQYLSVSKIFIQEEVQDHNLELFGNAKDATETVKESTSSKPESKKKQKLC